MQVGVKLIEDSKFVPQVWIWMRTVVCLYMLSYGWMDGWMDEPQKPLHLLTGIRTTVAIAASTHALQPWI